MKYDEAVKARVKQIPVVLTSSRHGDTISNPVWKGLYGRTKGYITYINGRVGLCAQVTWDNGTANFYAPEDLTEIYYSTNEPKEPERKIKGLFNL